MKEIIIALNLSKNIKLDISNFNKEFNRFILLNKKKDVLISFYVFSSDVRGLLDRVPIDEIKGIRNLVPQGECDLYNSLGAILERTSDKLNRLKDKSKPEKIVFAIISEDFRDIETDYSKEEVKTFISYQKEDYAWEFMFFNAGIKLNLKELGLSDYDIFKIDCSEEGVEKIFTFLGSKL